MAQNASSIMPAPKASRVPARRFRILYPVHLPGDHSDRRKPLREWLPWVEVRGLCVGPARVDVLITRGRSGAGVEALDRKGDLEVVVRR